MHMGRTEHTSEELPEGTTMNKATTSDVEAALLNVRLWLPGVGRIHVPQDVYRIYHSTS